jgi:hypothetical protein
MWRHYDGSVSLPDDFNETVFDGREQILQSARFKVK